jgi:hypothetical protein
VQRLTPGNIVVQSVRRIHFSTNASSYDPVSKNSIFCHLA